MPGITKRVCRAPGCSATTTARHGYCEKHADLAVGWNQYRSTSAASGRGGRPWRRLREQILQRDRHLCQTCKRKGMVTPAYEVDHIKNVASGGSNAPSNLEAICRSCHAVKTARESVAAKSSIKVE